MGGSNEGGSIANKLPMFVIVDRVDPIEKIGGGGVDLIKTE